MLKPMIEYYNLGDGWGEDFEGIILAGIPTTV
ncbi:hypothetical protein PL9631_1020034 [Planktothrix paucivesiculata PCC 9631]|uniref:Uncharacterized protein n=1 Tax=Planktothrix paucivesiculata PCC 9631 TaxID=671071 RepID=A0A7Z9DVR6_9CYAN|nr:hypothetical protein PL9631_1020034 [Planktothrix paucivesiculata PCC 9631]